MIEKIEMSEVVSLRNDGQFEELTRRGVTISAGPSDQKADGWLKAPFCGMTAHYFEQDNEYPTISDGYRVRFWNALCGASATTYERAPMLNPGNWPRCKNCVRKAANHG